MPEYLLFPWVSLSVIAPLFAAVLAWRERSADRARHKGCAALTVSALSLLAARIDVVRGNSGTLHLESWEGLFPEGWFGVDALNAIPLLLFAALALGITMLAPRRKVSARWVAGVLLVTSATLAAYAAENLVILLLAWTLSATPFLTRRFFTISGEQEMPPLSRGALLASILCLAAGAALLVIASPADRHHALSLSFPRSGNGAGQCAAFSLLMAAVFLRKGLLPVHSWLVAAFERGPLLPLTLLLNGHLGVFLVARLAIPALPDVARTWMPLVGDLGLLAAAYTALVALAEPQPRRILALLSISQAAFLLVGLESSNADGIVGALLHWQVVAVSTTILTAVYTALEARVGIELDNRRYLGLASGAPRLAVFFLVAGLALVGLPPLLGFCAEDLLLHGTLARHPHLGVIMPVVTALNAFSVLRLFARLFLGKPGAEARGLADALPRERWVLTAALLFLLIGGLIPGPLLQFPTAAAERLTAIIQPTHQAQVPNQH